MKKHFQQMAVYNQQMNTNVYQMAAQLSTADLAKDRGAFFGSISGTLNHILVGDILWLKRFASHQTHFVALEQLNSFELPDSLNAVLYSEWSQLLLARELVDNAIIQFTAELTDSVIAEHLTYTNTKGQLFTRSFGLLLQHLFNHQTHHRGQVSTLLYQLGLDIGVTDLIAFIPED
ncbi:MAG: DinB family protein [Arenicella sp.]